MQVGSKKGSIAYRSSVPTWIAKGSPTVRKSLFIWALPVWVGGSKPLPGWFVAPIFRRNVHVQTGICMILPENRCHRVPV